MNQQQNSELSRRELLKSAAATGLAFIAGVGGAPTAPGQIDGVTHTGNAAERSVELGLRARPH